MSRHAKRRPEPIAAWIPRVLRDVGLEESARAAQIADRWAEWLGEETAGHCRPVLLRGDILELSADSNTWAQVVRLRAPEILETLADRLGAEAPSGIRVRVGWSQSKDAADGG